MSQERLTAEEALAHPWLVGDVPSIPMDATVVDALKKFHASSKFKQAVCKLMAQDLSEESQKSMEANFQRLDKDHDGAISIDELRDAMISMVRAWSIFSQLRTFSIRHTR